MGNRLRLLAGKRDAFSLYDIPRSLKYSEFDFERSSQMTNVGGALSAFVDPVTGASFSQAVSGSRPTIEATDFNNRPGVNFDGTDDNNRNTTAVATLGWPTGGAFELWGAFQFLGTVGDSARVLFCFPASAGVTSLSFQTDFSIDGRRNMLARVGDGAAATNVPGAVDISTGCHFARIVSTGTTVRIDVDGVAGTPSAVVPAFSGTPRHTIGATGASTPGSYWKGRINFIGFYRPLPDGIAASLTTHLKQRTGVP